MEVYEISPAVNRVANDSPELLEPYSADAAASRAPAEAKAARPQAAPGGHRPGLAVLMAAE